MSEKMKKEAQEALNTGLTDLYRSRFAKRCSEYGLPAFRTVEELDQAANLAKTAMENGVYVPLQKHAAIRADRQWSEFDCQAIQQIATGLRKSAALKIVEECAEAAKKLS